MEASLIINGSSLKKSNVAQHASAVGTINRIHYNKAEQRGVGHARQNDTHDMHAPYRNIQRNGTEIVIYYASRVQ